MGKEGQGREGQQEGGGVGKGWVEREGWVGGEREKLDSSNRKNQATPRRLDLRGNERKNPALSSIES
jgi:hypothetical protein